MNKKLIGSILLVISSAFILSACNKTATETNSDTTGAGEQKQQQTQAQTTFPNQDVNDQIKIEVTDEGFLPSSNKVQKDGTIVWSNKSSSKVQIGSAEHPTHNENRDITGGQFVIELAPGESKNVTVTTVGKWGFHDHLNPSFAGTVEVI